MKRHLLMVALAMAALGGPAGAGVFSKVEAHRLDETTVVISARARREAGVDKALFKRAAEETLAAGYDGFRVEGETSSSETRGMINSNYGMLRSRPTGEMRIHLFRGPKPAGDGFYDAREVLKFNR